MPVKLRCGCGKVLSARDESRGKAVKCPGCGARVTVPTARAKTAPAAIGQERECVVCRRPLSQGTIRDTCGVCTGSLRPAAGAGGLRAWAVTRGADLAMVWGIACGGAFAVFAIIYRTLLPALAVGGVILLVGQGVVGMVGRRFGGPRRIHVLISLGLGAMGAFGICGLHVLGRGGKPLGFEVERAIREYCLRFIVRKTDKFGRALDLQLVSAGTIDRVDVSVVTVGDLCRSAEGGYWPVVADVSWSYEVREGRPYVHRMEGVAFRIQRQPGGLWVGVESAAGALEPAAAAPQAPFQAGPAAVSPAPEEPERERRWPEDLVVEGDFAPGAEILVFSAVDSLPERLQSVLDGEGVIASTSSAASLPLAPGTYMVMVRRRIALEGGHFYERIHYSDGRVGEQHLEKIGLFSSGGGSFTRLQTEWGSNRCDGCAWEFPASLDTALGGADYLIGSVSPSEFTIGCVFSRVTKEEGFAAVVTVSNRTVLQGLER